KNTPKDTPKNTPKDTPKNTPKDTPKNTPKDTPKNTPKDTPKDTHSTNKPSKTKKLPGTGDTNGMLLFAGGLVLLFLGLHLRRKSTK
ncbi:LPXTG cell wall anchor domain-containing protein, partial [Listeria monocytogenes]|uniref:LPXTG cell wall anchor domain-containing protein n=1 Tax=Listeria monocytogenes TaxID=1639 RepID=UPI000E762D45